MSFLLFLVLFLAFVATNLDDFFILLFFFSQRHSKVWRIVGGQYLGFLLILLCSLSGALGTLLLSSSVIGLLGFVPLVMGIWRLVKVPPRPKLKESAPASAFSVAMITFANGGDNLGIYVPLFSTIPPSSLLSTLIFFLFLVGVWCLFAFLLARRSFLAAPLRRSSALLTPFIYLFLGFYVLVQNGTFLWLASFL